MAGIQNFKEAAVCGAHIVYGVARTMDDGQLTPSDALHFAEAAKTIVPAIKDADEIPTEISDMDDKEAAEVLDAVRSVFVGHNMSDEAAGRIAVVCAKIGLSVLDGVNVVNQVREEQKAADAEHAEAQKAGEE